MLFWHINRSDFAKAVVSCNSVPKWDGGLCEKASHLSDKRDLRFVTVRRGGTLQDAGHRLLAVWAADCAQHVLHFFEQTQPGDDRPRRAIEQARAWARGEITMTQARTAAFAANAAAREVFGAAKEAAHAAG